MSEYRFVSRSNFGETLESRALPVVGAASQHARRAQAWQRIVLAFGCLCFALGTAVALVAL